LKRFSIKRITYDLNCKRNS